MNGGMISGYGYADSGSGNNRQPQTQDLFERGWQPLVRQFDQEFFLKTITDDPLTAATKTIDALGAVTNILGRNQYAWWSNALNMFSSETRWALTNLWDYMTPQPAGPSLQHTVTLEQEIPVPRGTNRQQIPVDHLLNQLQEVIVLRTLQSLGTPDSITQEYLERYFYYPPERFRGWNQIDNAGTVTAFWGQHDIWLELGPPRYGRRRFTLISKNLKPWIAKTTYNLSAILSGHQSRIGEMQKPFAISQFPEAVQDFSIALRQEVMQRHKLAALAYGIPGTERRLGLRRSRLRFWHRWAT